MTSNWIDPNDEPHATKVALALGEEMRTHDGALGFQWTLALIASALRDAKREVYEEVEQILDRRAKAADDGDVDTGAAVRVALDDAAVEVRALADSIGRDRKGDKPESLSPNPPITVGPQ